MAHETCLTAETLIALWNDQLPPDEEAIWSDHLSHCADCCGLAERLSHDEPFRAHFRSYDLAPKPLPEWVDELTQQFARLSQSDAVAFRDALSRLEQVDSQAAELVKLRIDSGLTLEDAAAVLGISTPAAQSNWSFAQAWLFRELNPQSL